MTKKIQMIMFFVLLFYINIGAKEVFNFFHTFDFVEIGVFFLSLLSITILFANYNKQYKSLYVAALFFYTFLIFSSFFSSTIAQGLQKAYMGLLLPLTLFSVFSKREWRMDDVLKYIIVAVVIIDVIAIFFKIRHGFWNRSVSFGLLGPITTGWLNGMAFFASIFSPRKGFNTILLGAFFFVVILWTGSKGPLVALLIVFACFFSKIFKGTAYSKIFILLLVFSVSFILFTYSEEVRSVNMMMRLVESPDEYIEGAGSGSFGARLDYYSYSIKLFQESPLLGVGFSEWANNTFGDRYPHNIILELISETGLLGMFFFLILILKFKYNNPLSIIGFFALVTLLFSGDFSYFRYAFYPLLIGFYFNLKQSKKSTFR